MCRLFFSNQPHKARIVAQVMDGNRGLESLSLDQIASEWLFCYLNRNPLNSNTQVLSSTPHYLSLYKVQNWRKVSEHLKTVLKKGAFLSAVNISLTMCWKRVKSFRHFTG